jgi:hypothetical protein
VSGERVRGRDHGFVTVQCVTPVHKQVVPLEQRHGSPAVLSEVRLIDQPGTGPHGSPGALLPGTVTVQVAGSSGNVVPAAVATPLATEMLNETAGDPPGQDEQTEGASQWTA